MIKLTRIDVDCGSINLRHLSEKDGDVTIWVAPSAIASFEALNFELYDKIGHRKRDCLVEATVVHLLDGRRIVVRDTPQQIFRKMAAVGKGRIPPED